MKSPRFALIALAATLIAGTTVYADEIALNERPGKIHVVTDGDTLWDIATAYLEDPYKWPKIWGFNDQVINPDLIFPGGKIDIPLALLKPEIRARVVAATPKSKDLGYVPVLSVSAPRGMLNPALVETGGYIIDKIRSVGKVLGMQEDRYMLGQGDTIFVKISKKAMAKPGSKFHVVRKVRKIRHPESHRTIGDLVRVLGMVEISAQNGKVYTGTLVRSYDFITSGDKLIPFERPDVDIVENDPGQSGTIVALQEDRAMSGDEDVIYLDRGRAEGLGPGMTMKVTRAGSKLDPTGVWGTYELPDRTIATLMVLSVREHNATAWVQHSLEPLLVGDRFYTQPPQIHTEDTAYAAGPGASSDS